MINVGGKGVFGGNNKKDEIPIYDKESDTSSTVNHRTMSPVDVVHIIENHPSIDLDYVHTTSLLARSTSYLQSTAYTATLVPNYGTTQTLGTDSSRWDWLYCDSADFRLGFTTPSFNCTGQGRFSSGSGDIYVDPSGSQIKSTQSNFSILSSSNVGFYISGGGSWRPTRDNSHDIGSSSVRCDDLYATNTSINTSDLREKEIIEDAIPDALLDAWGENVTHKVFKWKTGNRKHCGIIAQDIIAAFNQAGLDWTEYALLCVGDKEDDIIWNKDDIDNLPRIGVRSAQVSFIEDAYQRRRLDRLEQLIDSAKLVV